MSVVPVRGWVPLNVLEVPYVSGKNRLLLAFCKGPDAHSGGGREKGMFESSELTGLTTDASLAPHSPSAWSLFFLTRLRRGHFGSEGSL
jgi:hypothetical protein